MSAAEFSPGDETLARILHECRTIAMVGASPKPQRPSHGVMRYLKEQGYRVIPVNPAAAGDTILGETACASLADVSDQFQLVDVFRKAEAVAGVVDELLALENRPALRVLWLQLGVIDYHAAARARDAGLEVVMDRCIRIEHGRLM